MSITPGTPGAVATASPGTSITVPIVGATGDLAVVIIGGHEPSTTTPTWAAKSGWTIIKQGTVSPTTPHNTVAVVYARLRQAGDPATVTFTCAASGYWTGRCVPYPGAKMPYGGVLRAVDQDSGSPTFAGPAITTVTNGDWPVTLFASFYDDTWNTPTGGTIRTQCIVSGNGSIALVDAGGKPAGTYTQGITQARGSGGAMFAGIGFAIPPVSVPSPPATPTGVRARAGDGRVVLTWAAVPSATGYKVMRGGTLLATITGDVTYSIDTTVANGTAYSYTVIATGDGGDSTASTAVAATPAARPIDTRFIRRRGFLANRSGDIEGINPSEYDVIICNPGYYSQLPALKAAHRGTQFWLYQNAYAITKDGTNNHTAVSVLWSDADTNHPEWFLSNGSGRLIFSDFPGNQWLDISLPAARTAWADQVIARVTTDGWDGVFVDDVNADMAHLGSQTAPAKFPSDLVWRKAMRDHIHVIAWRLRDAGIPHMANVAYNFSGDWDTDVAPDVLADWDTAFQEFWAYSTSTSGGVWFTGGDISYQLARADLAHGLLVGHAPNDYLTAADAKGLRYHEALAVISMDRTLPGCSIISGQTAGAAMHPATGVGWPTDAAASTTDGYTRTCTEGVAAANAATASQTVDGAALASTDGRLRRTAPTTTVRTPAGATKGCSMYVWDGATRRPVLPSVRP